MNNTVARVLLGCLLSTLLSPLAIAAAPQDSASGSAGMPRLVQRDGRYALMVDGAPFLVLGAQVNNCSAWEASCPRCGRRWTFCM